MNHWINESVSQWLYKRMNEWMTWRMGGRMDRWVNYFSLLSYFFAEQPLRWGTSSLSYSFSDRPLIWATSALSCLPANFFVASAIQFFLSRNWHNPFNNLQLQSRLPGASQHHSCFAPRSRANAFFVTAGWKAASQKLHTQSTNVRAALFRTPQSLRSLCGIELLLQSGAHFADLIFQKCSERGSFWTFWSAHRALATVWCSFCRPNLPKVFRTWQFFLTFWSAHRNLATVWCTFCQLNLPKVFRMWQWFNILKCTSSSRYSLWRILPT